MRRAESTWRQYESSEGFDYDALWELSRINAEREVTISTPRMTVYGQTFTKSQAEGWRKKIETQGCDLSHEDRLTFMGEVMDAMDPVVASYFRSEYMPLFLRFYANKPDDERPYAAQWHCDAGPRKHLKLLLYLNSTEESGGNTEFLDYDTTMRLDEAGYLFCNLDQRLADLSELCSSQGIPYKPCSHPMRPGDGVLFEPSCIMHKALWPTRGTRYMAQILFLPSPIPWQQACEHFDMPFRDNAWRRFEFS